MVLQKVIKEGLSEEALGQGLRKWENKSADIWRKREVPVWNSQSQSVLGTLQ